MKINWIKKLVPAGKLLLAAVIIILLVSKADVKNLLKSDLDNSILLAALLLILLQNLLGALRWWSLLNCAGIKIPFGRALSITMQGIFWMMFLPGGTLGGDVVKATLAVQNINKNLQPQAALSVLIDRICGCCGMALFAMTVSIVFLVGKFYPESIELRYLFSAAALLSPLILLAAVFFICGGIFMEKSQFFCRIINWSNRISKGLVCRILEALNSYRAAWHKCLLWSVVSGVIGFPLFSAALFCINAALPGGLSADKASGAAALVCGSVGELSGLLPLTPGGIGVRDAVFCFIYNAFGAAEEAVAVQIPLIFTALTVIASLVGGVFALGMLLRKKR